MRKLYEIFKLLWIQKIIIAAATIWGNTVYVFNNIGRRIMNGQKWHISGRFASFKLCQGLKQFFTKVIHWIYCYSVMIRMFYKKQRNGFFILFWKLFVTPRKNCYCNQEKLLQIWGWRPRSWKCFEISRTIYSSI